MGLLFPTTPAAPGVPGQSPGFVSGFLQQYGMKILYAFIAYMIFRFILWLWPMPNQAKGRKVVTKKKETFQPREEAHDSWVRL